MAEDTTDLKHMPDAYWRDKLDAHQYNVLREAGTEAPFTGTLLGNHDDGRYHCGACNQALFASGTKFESGSGWPSFYQALDGAKVDLVDDTKFGMHRVEVRCGNCGSHLGHVFPDGPAPTGDRYCLNSAALTFEPTTPA